MQSFLQYRKIRKAVQEQIETGLAIDNFVPAKHPSVLEPQKDVHRTISRETWEETPTESHEKIIVGWAGPEDPHNPRNWSSTRCYIIFFIIFYNVFAVDYGAGADSQASSQIAKEFHVSKEAEALSPSLYTFGIAAGSLFAGPIGETTGRNPIYVISRCLHVAWLIGAALAPNFGAQCAFRFLAGLCGSIINAIHAASVADIYGPLDRSVAWPVMALSSFFGTAASPIVGAWIVQSNISWRWTEWIAVLISASSLIPTLLFLPETFSPIILSWRAKHIRDLTGNDRFHADAELQASLIPRFRTALTRAFRMLFHEPIVVFLGGWLVAEYLCVYGFLQGFKFVFGDTYNFDKGLVGSSFSAIALGTIIWTLGVPVYHHLYKRKIGTIHQQITGEHSSEKIIKSASSPGKDLPDPEYRLWSAVLAAPAFPISLFWLGWSNYAKISVWSDLGAVVLLGFSWAGIYITVYQYILDTYGIYAGSALAMITCWRYLGSGTINLVSEPMYNALGVHWTLTLFGCLALLQMPLPVIFYYYGPRLRQRSEFAGQFARKEDDGNNDGKMISWRLVAFVEHGLWQCCLPKRPLLDCE